MASKTLADGRKVLIGSKADPDSVNFQPKNTAPLSSGTPDFSASINSSVLAPQKGFTIPPVAPATESAALQGTIQAQTDQFTKGLEQKAKAAETAKTSSLDDLLSTLKSQEGQSSLTAQAEKEAGVDTLDVELKDINNQLLQEQVALQRRTETIEKNSGGMLRSQVSAEIERATRDSLRKQADLSVIQMGIQGKYDSAVAFVSRAVNAAMESQRKELDILSLIYNENKDLFNTTEQRLFNTQQADRERLFAEERQNKTDIYNLALEASKAGASSGTMQAILAAKTPEEALSTASSVLGPKAPVASLQFVSATANQPAGVFNPRTGEFTAIDSGTTSQADTANLQIVNDATGILTSPAFNSTFGLKNTIQRLIPSTDAYYLAQKVNNFTSQLSLAARGELKGQGQISDFEGKMLKEAQTALTLNLSPQQASKEIAKARGAIRTSSGLTTRVKVIDPETGASQYVEAGQDGINQAIEDGLIVEYQ